MDQILIVLDAKRAATRRVLENAFNHLHNMECGPISAEQTQAMFTIAGCLVQLDDEAQVCQREKRQRGFLPTRCTLRTTSPRRAS